MTKKRKRRFCFHNVQYYTVDRNFRWPYLNQFISYRGDLPQFKLFYSFVLTLKDLFHQYWKHCNLYKEFCIQLCFFYLILQDLLVLRDVSVVSLQKNEHHFQHNLLCCKYTLECSRNVKCPSYDKNLPIMSILWSINENILIVVKFIKAC